MVRDSIAYMHAPNYFLKHVNMSYRYDPMLLFKSRFLLRACESILMNNVFKNNNNKKTNNSKMYL